MKKFLASHNGYYISLGLMLVICFALIAYFSGQPMTQMVLLLVCSLSYAIWGMLHHFVHHDISIRIVLEYILIAMVGMSLAFLISR